MSDWQDRIVDAALRQAHGEQPPDQTAIVLHRLQTELAAITRVPASEAAAVAAVPLAVAPAGRARWPQLFAGAAFGAAAAALLVWCVLPWLSPMPAAGAIVEVAALRGAVAFGAPGVADAIVDAPPPLVVDAGEHAAWRAQVGSTVASRGERGVDLWLGDFGVLSTEPHTRMEVRSMELSVKSGAIAAGVLTFAVVAGVVTWHSLTHNETAAAGQELRLAADAKGGGSAAVVVENQQLKDQLAALRDELAQLKAEHERQAVAAPKPASLATVTEQGKTVEPAVAASGKPSFDDDRFREMLASIDWKMVGETNRDMAPLLQAMVDAMKEDGAEVPLDKAIALQKLNAKLVELLPALDKAGLPGFGLNGTFTHPLMASNSLASLLDSSGKGLDDSQRAAMAKLVRGYSAEMQGIAEQKGDFSLETLAAEAASKERFYDEMAGMLTPEQRAAVYPDGQGQYEGTNLFRTGVLWRSVSEPMQVASPTDYARVTSQKLQSQLGLDDNTAAQVRAVIDRTATLSPGLFRDKAAPIEVGQAHFLKSGRSSAALQTQLQWMREIAQNVQLTPEQRQKLASMKRVFVPLPR